MAELWQSWYQEIISKCSSISIDSGSGRFEMVETFSKTVTSVSSHLIEGENFDKEEVTTAQALLEKYMVSIKETKTGCSNTQRAIAKNPTAILIGITVAHTILIQRKVEVQKNIFNWHKVSAQIEYEEMTMLKIFVASAFVLSHECEQDGVCTNEELEAIGEDKQSVLEYVEIIKKSKLVIKEGKKRLQW